LWNVFGKHNIVKQTEEEVWPAYWESGATDDQRSRSGVMYIGSY
jgi:hypothetical protein